MDSRRVTKNWNLTAIKNTGSLSGRVFGNVVALGLPADPNRIETVLWLYPNHGKLKGSMARAVGGKPGWSGRHPINEIKPRRNSISSPRAVLRGASSSGLSPSLPSPGGEGRGEEAPLYRQIEHPRLSRLPLSLRAISSLMHPWAVLLPAALGLNYLRLHAFDYCFETVAVHGLN